VARDDKGTFRTAVANINSLFPEGPVAAVLLVIRGPCEGLEVALERAGVDIGREGCALTIPNDMVSRRHAIVESIAGGYMIRDLSSTNGTFVNDAKIQVQALKDGDQIRIGKSVIKFLTTANPEHQYLKGMFQKLNTDALTGANNKRHFDESLPNLVTQAAQQNKPLSLVVLDIDFFKKVNDTHGHAGGDFVLQQVSHTIAAQVREHDLFARVGGEEFCILLPNTTRGMAVAACELIRGTVEMTDFEYEGKRIPVTLSLGVAELNRANAETPEALYKRADAKLYEAKKGGRNRVCS
jgi:diguanylate cyclase (GGDEF)-like protein